MTPDAMAALHSAAFTLERPWSAPEFQALLDSDYVSLLTQSGGFALYRTAAGETELLTLAVAPDQQRQGIGRALTQHWLARAQDTAQQAFLEVASDNAAAIGLYQALGFERVGLRRAYYLRKNRPAADAIVMQYDLTLGQSLDSSAVHSESG